MTENINTINNSEFIKFGENIVPKPKGCDYNLIPGKVYDLAWNDMRDEVIFKENGELNLPKKVYQSEADIIFKKRVLTYYNTTSNQNTGIMLAGTKGTGKTVMAKVLAKESGLPIIIVDPKFPERRLVTFFKQFNTPVCVLFDEIEKNFRTDWMLDFLDGVEKTAKKLVLMTCNELNKVSEYIQDRCSRLRYLRKYTTEDNLVFLPMLVDDFNIKNKEEVIKFCTEKIQLLSMDNICSFLTEVKLLEDDNVTLDDIINIMNISTNASSTIYHNESEIDEYDEYDNAEDCSNDKEPF